jgi:hypothetical protein
VIFIANALLPFLLDTLISDSIFSFNVLVFDSPLIKEIRIKSIE